VPADWTCRGAAAGALTLLLAAAAAPARGQIVSDLEPERPISVQDARPVPYRALSGSADWTYTVREERLNDYGPGFSLLYGVARSVEVGADIRYVTRPERNSSRGISSGDLFLHALYALRAEDARWPALAMRVAVQFPTGLDSKGTDLHVAALATRSFDAFRLHANLLWTRLGAISGLERRERFEGIGGIDVIVSPRGRTDTLAVADVSLRTNPVVGGTGIVTLEGGLRQRIGIQTVLFAGAGSDLRGAHRDRARFQVRVGVTRLY
jgi:hypothetical protein